MAELGRDYLATMRTTLSNFYGEVGSFTQDHGAELVPGSRAVAEQAGSPCPDSLVTAWGLASQLIESGGEHVTTFVKTITEPMEPIACWTCVRSMLEPCALAAWLLDPGIDARTRVGRSFALRYEGLEQQIKFGRAAGFDNAKLESIKDHIEGVERDAIRQGYPRLMDPNRRRTGIGQRMPSATEVIKLALDEEAMYRLLSAVAHGHHWAISRLGFKLTAEPASGPRIGGVRVGVLEKAVSVDGMAYLGLGAAKALARPLWNQCRYFGWDEAWLARIFDHVFDQLRATPAVRFWRGSSS